MRMILGPIDKRALQDQVSFGLTLVVQMGCLGFFFLILYFTRHKISKKCICLHFTPG